MYEEFSVTVVEIWQFKGRGLIWGFPSVVSGHIGSSSPNE